MNGTNTHGFVCSICGENHSELFISYGTDAPEQWYQVPPEERESRTERTDDWCIIDNEFFFVRGCIEIPVVDGAESFVWGAWVSLSEENFARTMDLWHVEGRENEHPYFGWLSTSIEIYPETLNLKTMVQTRPVGMRPIIELEPTDHPLAVEQREGITMARVREFAELFRHAR